LTVTTTCTGPTPNCTSGTCVVGPVMLDCAISVVTGDGMTHNVSVGVQHDDSCGKYIVTQPMGQVSFASATCVLSDAGVDADTGVDASSDAPSETGDANDSATDSPPG
jgi:hypothetical protein